MVGNNEILKLSELLIYLIIGEAESIADAMAFMQFAALCTPEPTDDLGRSHSVLSSANFSLPLFTILSIARNRVL